jgi:hypothetical protein
MLVFGSLLALISGMFNAAAGALEKWEGMRSGTGPKGPGCSLCWPGDPFGCWRWR